MDIQVGSKDFKTRVCIIHYVLRRLPTSTYSGCNSLVSLAGCYLRTESDRRVSISARPAEHNLDIRTQ